MKSMKYKSLRSVKAKGKDTKVIGRLLDNRGHPISMKTLDFIVLYRKEEDWSWQ